MSIHLSLLFPLKFKYETSIQFGQPPVRSNALFDVINRARDRHQDDLSRGPERMLQLFGRLCGGFSRRRRKQKEKESPARTVSTELNAETKPRTVHQPLHPSIRSHLDPEYVAFHDQYIQYVEPEHLKPWSQAVRSRITWPYAGSPLVEVERVWDMRPCPNFAIRIFSPFNKSKTAKKPLVIWLHGGGFAGGNIDSDNDLCSLVCKQADCIVANVDYRLAPENPYPAAIEDVVEALKWFHSDAGATELGIDRTRIAIAGASAGANLATVGALLAAELGLPLALQVLVVPVTDNSATLDTSWSAHPHAPGLTPARMTWYRNLYLEGGGSALDWKVSPIFAPSYLMSKLPKSWIAIAGQDMLSIEGLAYAQMLKEAAVDVSICEYEGVPHGMMAMSGKSFVIRISDQVQFANI